MLIVSASWGIAGGAVIAQESECWDTAPSMESGYPQWAEAPEMVIDTSKTYTATLETNRGNIVVELADDEAPNTVNNYVCLARSGYYDVTIFHRIISGFMIQGGDPTGTGSGGPGYKFDDELPGGDAPYVRGTLAMANAGENTNGSQFFIVQQDQPAEFTANYSIFGHVTEGLEVLDTIASVPVGPSARGENSAPMVTLGIKTIIIAES
jgi:cyclophilin family peptidyl-prolyl cis-trans isomerase